jgi:thioredoxin-like negative regulator of GroEL
MIDPGLAAAVLLLGELDEREGQVDQAALTYETALRDNPGSMELAGKLIRLLEGQKRFAEVADVLDSLVGADPRRVADLRIHIALGGGDTAAAMDELRRRIAADPKDATSRVSLAQLLYAQRQDVDGVAPAGRGADFHLAQQRPGRGGLAVARPRSGPAGHV